MNKTISVWLIIQDGKNKGKIPLQKRAFYEQSFPYICQASWSGKFEVSEKAEEAAKRECAEELGKDFSDNVDFSKLKMLPKSSFAMKGGKWETINYLNEISEKLLKKTKLHKDAFPDFIFIGKGDNFYPVSSGKDPQKNVVLFEDQYEILRNIIK